MNRRFDKGFALILIIFIMMVFGVLGWTLAVMQAGNFESSVRNLQSRQALYLAEAGTKWGLYNRVTTGETSSSDSDCLDSGDWVNHTLGSGQYQVCTRVAAAGESADVVIESTGYVPSAAAYKAKRQVKMMVFLGSFTKSVMAKGLFDWVDPLNNHTGSYVAGDMMCMFYESNGFSPHNELGADYDSTLNHAIPATNRARGALREVGSGLFPEIEMSSYETDSNAIILAFPKTSAITAVTTVDGNARTQVTLADPNFFNLTMADWPGVALRDISQGAWKTGSWKDIQRRVSANTAVVNGTVNWAVNDRLTIVPKITTNPVFNSGQHTYNFTFNANLTLTTGQAIRNLSRGTWAYTDWGVIQAISHPQASTTNVTVLMDNSVTVSAWQLNNWICPVRRFNYVDADRGILDNNDNQHPRLLYIESDVLFDVRDTANNRDIKVDRTGVVIEGDVTIRGTNGVSFTERPYAYPNLATKNGNVYSPDVPLGNRDSDKTDMRNFDDIIFTQNGNIVFNYLDTKAIYGNNITLSGLVRIRYDSDLERLGGYGFGVAGHAWNEQ
jgi:hypothetical protein